MNRLFITNNCPEDWTNNTNVISNRIFEPKREEVTGGCRKLHNDNFYFSPGIVIIIRSRRIRLTEL
jgi:hypothetical protein